MRRLVLVAAIVGVALTGCNKDRPEEAGKVAVNLTTDIQSSTLKVTNDQWEAADRVGLYMKKTGQALTEAGAIYAGADNVQMSIVGGALRSNPSLLYPGDGNVDFIAYHPYTTSVDASMAVAVDVTGQATGLPVEVLYSNNATNQAPTASAVMLNFLYSLAKVEVTVTGGANSILSAADYAAMTVSVEGLYTQALLQLADGTITDRTQQQAITLHKKSSTATSATFEMLALPSAAAEAATFLFNIDGVVYSCETTANYDAAKLYRLGFELNFPAVTLITTHIVPRDEAPPQSYSVDASQPYMTMTTEAQDVLLRSDGTGKMFVDWGDGTPSETYTLSESWIYVSHSYSGTSSRTIKITGENIKMLFCDDNQLKTLEVSKNTALENLSCSNNQLESLDLSGCTALLYLHCAYNHQLESLDVSGCTELSSLFCRGNQLESLDVSGCTALLFFQCYGNLLTSAALDTLFGTLDSPNGIIYIGNNPGTDTCNQSIATAKEWSVKTGTVIF